jgi:hypothetical protein
VFLKVNNFQTRPGGTAEAGNLEEKTGGEFFIWDRRVGRIKPSKSKLFYLVLFGLACNPLA